MFDFVNNIAFSAFIQSAYKPICNDSQYSDNELSPTITYHTINKQYLDTGNNGSYKVWIYLFEFIPISPWQYLFHKMNGDDNIYYGIQ